MSAPNNPKRFTPKKPDNLIDGTEIVDTTEGLSTDMDISSDSVDTTGESTPDVTIKDTESAPPVKNVKVRTVCDHRCCIGGEWYDFKKGVQKTVPEEVKTVLLKAELLMPL